MRNTEHYKAGSGIEEHAWIHEHQIDFGTVMANQTTSTDCNTRILAHGTSPAILKITRNICQNNIGTLLIRIMQTCRFIISIIYVIFCIVEIWESEIQDNIHTYFFYF